MGEETNTPVAAAEPPKANPLGAPVHPMTGGGAPTPRPAAGGLRPGLKLPPKPGLAAGLKLPPKAGGTVKLMRPGLKLPPKPGLAAGLKLPTRPVIRRPGEVAPAPAGMTPVTPTAPKPAAPAGMTPVTPTAPKPAAPAGMTPVTPTAPKPAAPAGMTPVTPRPKPITATMPKPAGASVAPKPAQSSVDQLKSLTQHLKSVTAPIPVQAILHKTGIIADPTVPDVQKEASKHKTSRISLSDAMGVTAAPATPAAPMKTIRIKRPTNIPSASHPAAAPAATSPAPAPVAVKPAAAPAAAAPAAPKPTAPAAPSNVTQRKTLKVQRPAAGGRPKFTTKKPTAAPVPKAPEGAVADIPDIPDLPAVAPAPAANGVSGVPTGVAVMSVLVQLAACAVMGFLAWQLFKDCQLDLFCGGCALFQ